ncbi:MAG: pyridoxal-phosphate dependent enzyme [Alphaproteobacteria bacterium]
MLIQKLHKEIFDNYSSSIATPKLVRVLPNLVIAIFELMKLIPAKYTILKALKEGKIDRKYPIIETSSGTYALGMGIVCAELEIPFFIVSDPVIDECLRMRLEDLGGNVQIISAKSSGLDIQSLRLEYLNQYLLNNKGAFWPAQYNNPENREAYNDFAKYLLDNVGDNFTLVGAVGSGGSTCGTIETLRKVNNNIKLVGVDTFGSVLFGLPNKDRKLRGLGNSIFPQNLIHEYFDQVHWVNEEVAINNVRRLHASKSLFCGPTTGAAYHVGNWIAKNNTKDMIVVISPDSGYRYMSTAYNNDWLKMNKINISNDFPIVKHATLLSHVQEPWSYFNWNRRTFEDVVGVVNE